MSWTKARQACVVLAVLVLAAGAAFAQAERGGLYGTVLDNAGDRLPGVTITISGVGAAQMQVTGADGSFRFPALSVGRYQLRAELEGFSTAEYPSVVVSLNRNTTVEVTLTPAVEEVITVTAESPLLDERKLAAGTTVSQVELEKIPSARDPWSILTQTPGVVSDRINVGGNESGQQAVFRAPATDDDENDFLVDGVQITDMAAIGSSPTYYDFDQFEEMQFATGGTDITKASAGVSVNLVTKRGTNEFRGSARYFLTDAKGYFGALDQSDADVSGDLAPGQPMLQGNEIDRITDLGFEGGGPLLRDRLWAWGSWGQNDIRQFTAGGAPDNTQLENTAIKLNAQISGSNSALASFNNGDKKKQGRSAGPSRPPETTFNQRGPTGIYKVEDTHVFSSDFFLTGSWSKVDGGFSLTSQGAINAGCGGVTCPFELEALLDPDGIWRHSYYGFASSRPSEEIKADGAYYFNTGTATGHELKFGARLRDFESSTPFGWPGRNIVHFAGTNFGVDDGPLDFFSVWRGGWPLTEVSYTSFWAQDTISMGNWTVNAGFRYDVADGENPAATVAANPALPGDLPALNFGGNDGDGIEFESITPRVGVTYALGEGRKTLLRASFAQFAEALEISDIQRVNPLGFSIGYYYFIDANDNNMWEDASEPYGFLFPSGYDPSDPDAVVSPNRNDPGLDPAMTSELILGAEHSLLPEFVVGAQFTWREVTDVMDLQRFVRDTATDVVRVETAGDYVIGRTLETTLPDGTVVTQPEFNLRAGLEPTGGWLLTNGDRERSYMGLGLNWTKRLSNQWMLRGYVNYVIEDEWSVPGGYIDGFTGLNPAEDKSDVDGAVYAVQSEGSGNKGDVFLQSGWSWNLNGMYQVAPDRPWGFNVAANLFGREGYPLPYFVRFNGVGDGIQRDMSVVTDTDDFRTDDIFTVDLRLEKEFRTANNVGFTFSIDGFNVLDEPYVLQRERQLNTRRADYLDETLSPRIWRLGVRINWR